MANLSNGDYWIGSNGSVYRFLNGQGVVDFGALVKNGANGVGADTTKGSFEGRQIADPNPPKVAVASGPSNSNGTSGGSATAKVDKSNDIALNNAGLDAVGGQVSTGISAVDQALAKLLGQYQTETDQNQTSYNTNSDQNQNNLQKNKQTTYVNAAQGRQGVFGKLSSIGALNGSGLILANRAVQQGANEDLSSAADSFKTNQQSLDSALGAYTTENDRRKAEAADAADAAKKNVNNSGDVSRQKFYSNLADDYAAMGDDANSKKYAGLAASLYPSIAATSIPSTNLSYSGAAYTAPSLSTYLANGNTSVSSAPGSGSGVGVSSLPTLAAGLKKKQTA